MYSTFVSKSDINVKKTKRKEFFQSKLKKAKEEYESVKRKRELEDERGDSTWMLPSLEIRLKEENKSKKKKKKDKHKKKSKKHKQKKDDDDDEWEEAAQEQDKGTAEECNKELKNDVKQSTAQRDDWMMPSSLLDITSSHTFSRENKTKQRKIEQRRKEEEDNQLTHQSRELNPYWKAGGTGLPEESVCKNEKEMLKTKAETTKNIAVGDGGRSWIHKAYKRAKEQAQEEGIPLEEIVAKRWGSMEKLNALLKAAERSTRPTHSISKSGSGGWRKELASYGRKEKLYSNDFINSGSEKKQAEELGDKNMKSGYDDTSIRGGQKTTKPFSEIEQVPESKKLHLLKPISLESKSKNDDGDDDGSDDDYSDDVDNEVVIQPLSEKEKNEINAKILRAELMGDEELAAKLKVRLDTGTPVTVKRKEDKIKERKSKCSSESEDAEMILTRTDKHGNLYPVKLKTDVDELNHRTKRKKKEIMSTHDADGKRVRYFEDDDKMDLKTMVEQERLTSVSDHQAMMSRLAGKHLGTIMGDDYTLDDMFVAASATKGMTRTEDKQVKEKAVSEHKQRELRLANCRFCFENPKIAKHLIITIGINVYLALPINASLTDGHCLIVPMHHVVGQTFLDEDVIQEVKIFKKGITKMFSDMDEDVMFLETCKNIRHQNHCIIECVPVPKEIGDIAPIYFKKAITECESDWNQNKKLITVTSTDGLSKAVPKGLPYFTVEFGLDGGFAHVIEEEESFPYYFGKEIIGGMMDLEARLWRKPPRERFEQHKRKVLKFAELWKPYDWTLKLK